MRKTTLCFLRKDDKVLLAMKKRGFGVGKWNGVGGKVKEGEGVAEAAVREAQEEVGVVITPDSLRAAGILHFTFEGNPDWDQECHVFVAEEWSGEPSESEEMRPEWYEKAAIPFNEMWPDDSHWFPFMLSGKVFDGVFSFSGDGATMLTANVQEVRP